jgi:hypothetical protein
MPFVQQNVIPLFSERGLHELVREQIERAHNEVAKKDADELLNMPVEDQVDIIVAHFQLILPTLREDLAHSDDPRETTLRLTDYGRQISVAATTYQIRIPFDGHQGLFRHFPATRSSVPPFAALNHQELIISLVGYDVTAQDLNQEIDKTVSSIKQFLEWQRPQVDACNSEIRKTARSKIEERKARILQSRNIAASLRYPLRRRHDAPLIDQLLGYLTWRDTKSALIVFSRNKDFTAVIESIKAEIERHSHKKRGPEPQGQTRFRYIFGNPADHNREIIVTVMAFSVLPPSA